MSTSGSQLPATIGTGGVLSRAVSIVTDDLRIPAILVVSALVSAIPVIGSLLSGALSGIAMQFADETLGYSPTRKSIAVRFIYSIVAGILIGIIVAIGLLLLILPGIYLALKFALAPAAVWIDDQGPISALSVSWNRTAGHLLTLIGVGLVLGGIAFVIIMVAIFAIVPLDTMTQSTALFLTYPTLLVVLIGVSATIGSVGTAASTVMFRAFN